MDKDDVIRHLCILATKVMHEKYSCDISADCFCKDGEAIRRTLPFEFHPDIIRFIENAVYKELKS